MRQKAASSVAPLQQPDSDQQARSIPELSSRASYTEQNLYNCQKEKERNPPGYEILCTQTCRSEEPELAKGGTPTCARGGAGVNLLLPRRHHEASGASDRVGGGCFGRSGCGGCCCCCFLILSFFPCQTVNGLSIMPQCSEETPSW